MKVIFGCGAGFIDFESTFDDAEVPEVDYILPICWFHLVPDGGVEFLECLLIQITGTGYSTVRTGRRYVSVCMSLCLDCACIGLDCALLEGTLFCVCFNCVVCLFVGTFGLIDDLAQFILV